MADPAIISCPKDVWTKVATAVTSGQIHKMKNKGVAYLQTYRDTGGAVPTTDDPTDGVEAFEGSFTENISASVAIDIYLMPLGKDGEVRVDL